MIITASVEDLAKKLGVTKEVAYDLDQLAAPETVEAVSTVMPTTIETIIFSELETIKSIRRFDDTIIDRIKQPLEMTALEIESLKQSIKSSFTGAFDIDIKEQLKQATLVEQQAITSALEREAMSIVDKMFKEEIDFSTITDLISNMTDQIVQSAINLVDGVIGTISGIIDSITAPFLSAISNITGFLNNISSQFFSTIIGSIFGAIFGPLNIIAGFMKHFWDALIQVVSSAFLAGKFFFDKFSKIPFELGLGFADIRHGVLPGSLTPRPLTKHPLLPSESDVHRVSRGDDSVYQAGGMKYEYDSQRDPLIEDPPMDYSATYPYNHYFETESGHVFEYDDTPSHERIQYKHRTGTGIHINPDGSQRYMCVGDNYSILLGDDSVHIHGSANVYIDGSATLSVNNDLNINVGLNCNLSVGKDFTIDVGETFRVRAKALSPSPMPRIKPLHPMLSLPKIRQYGEKFEGDESVIRKKGIQTAVKTSDIKDGLESGQLSRAEQAERMPDIVTPVEEDDSKPNPPVPPSVPSIPTGAIKAPTNPADWRDKAYDQKISDYFYLRDLCHTNYAVYALKAQGGIPLQVIIQNLVNLAVIALDPIIDMFGNAGFSTYDRKPGPTILTCGFRHGSGGSWHLKGCAADFQFKGIGAADYFNRAIKMRDSIPGFDHILLEFKTTGTKAPWIHIGVVPGRANGSCQTYMNHVKKADKFINLAVPSRAR